MLPKRAQSPAEEAANPDTPLLRLLALTERHADHVLQNPALPLLLLESPDLWGSLSGPAKQAVASSSQCPSAFARWVLVLSSAKKDFDIRARLIRNEAVEPEIRRELFYSLMQVGLLWDRTAVSSFVSPIELDSMMHSRGLTAVELHVVGTNTWRRAYEAKSIELHEHHAATSIDLAVELDSAAAWEVAQNPAISPLRLELLLTADSPLREAALRNPAMAQAQFERAISSPDAQIRQWVCRNRALPIRFARRLALDISPEVRNALARKGLQFRFRSWLAKIAS